MSSVPFNTILENFRVSPEDVSRKDVLSVLKTVFWHALFIDKVSISLTVMDHDRGKGNRRGRLRRILNILRSNGFEVEPEKWPYTWKLCKGICVRFFAGVLSERDFRMNYYDELDVTSDEFSVYEFMVSVADGVRRRDFLSLAAMSAQLIELLDQASHYVNPVASKAGLYLRVKMGRWDVLSLKGIRGVSVWNGPVRWCHFDYSIAIFTPAEEFVEALRGFGSTRSVIDGSILVEEP